MDSLRSRARELLGLSIADEDGEPIIGHRPVSVDGIPVLGKISDGIFIATGTNRDGLSGAPRIASLLCEALQGDVAAIPPVMRPSADRTS
jgi:glycine/D-amino acid oxidase-like deaminating enzyme